MAAFGKFGLLTISTSSTTAIGVEVFLKQLLIVNMFLKSNWISLKYASIPQTQKSIQVSLHPLKYINIPKSLKVFKNS